MIIRIERDSGVPVTRQIVDQIRTQCATGALRSGDRLPSVRQLARELAVNQNTILRVYERLEAEGLIERRHGAGTFVSEQASDAQLEAQLEALRQKADALTRHAHSLGVGVNELKRIVSDSYRNRREADKEDGRERERD